MNTFLFLLMFAVSVAVTAVFLHEIKSDLKVKEKADNKLAKLRGSTRSTDTIQPQQQ